MRAGHGPLGKHPLKSAVGSRHLKCVAPSVAHEFVIERELGAQGEFVEDRLHRPANIFSSSLTGLQVDVDAAIGARGAAVQQVLKREQRRGLAGLPWRMQDEVLLLVDPIQHVIQVHALQWWYAVVILSVDGTFGVERAHTHIMLQNPTSVRCSGLAQAIPCRLARTHWLEPWRA